MTAAGAIAPASLSATPAADSATPGMTIGFGMAIGSNVVFITVSAW